MPKFPPFSDGRADAALSPELEVIERRLVLDAALWELDAPAESHLEDFARRVAVLERPVDTASDTASAAATGATPGASADAWLRTLDLGVLEAAETEPETPRRPELRARALATRPHARLTLAVVLLVAALALSVLARFAVFSPPHHGAEPTPTASPRATPHATTTPTTPATGVGAGAGGSVGPPSAPGDVTRVIIGPGLESWTTYCNGPQAFPLTAGFEVTPNSPAETITYRWLRSDGYVSPVESVQYTPIHPSNVLVRSSWALQPAQGDGSMRWVNIEVLSPNAITGVPFDLQLTCTWAVSDTKATVVSGGMGGNFPQYDCQAGGDQTFTSAGVINVDADSQSHTITYHWEQWNGTQTTQGPDQSITLAPGQLSASVPDDVLVLHQSDPKSNGYGDAVVVTSTPGVTTYGTQIIKSC